MAEIRLKEETTKAEARLADSFTVAEHRRKEQLDALESKLTGLIINLEKGLRAEVGLQFAELRSDIEWIKANAKNGRQQNKKGV